jgi:hypothetical protein
MKPAMKSCTNGTVARHAPAALLACLIVVLAAPGETSSADSSPGASPMARLARLLKHSPRTDTDFEQLRREATDLLEVAEAQAAKSKFERKHVRETVSLGNLPSAKLHDYFHDPHDHLSPRELRGLRQFVRLARCIAGAPSTAERAACMADFSEVRIALGNNRRSSLPEVVGPVSQWKFLIDHLQRRIGIGSSAATNVCCNTGLKPDAGKCDPDPSTFWIRPTNIPHQDLYAGFGRTQLPVIADAVCEYDGPKTSAGTTPGFNVNCEGVRYKIKFREFSSEPFTARIFHALGYHVDPTDHSPSVKVCYDRRMFREFNQRKPVKMRMKFFGIPLGSVNFQKRFDPFDFIVLAVFKDGRTVTGAELREHLLRNAADVHPEDDPSNFRSEVESSLDHLILAPANVQPADVPAESVGLWKFDGLGHEQRRELRAVGLLAAWLAWSDSRFDNTQLRFARDNGHIHFEHFFTDLGSGLGEATGYFSRRGEDPNRLTWAFTRPEIRRGPGRMTTPFKIVNYETIVRTPAFREMTVDDARWMARLIGQLTEAQLSAALIASGYDAAEARLYLEKLLHRRDQMVLDLGLKEEIPLLRPEGVNQHFSYSPSEDSPFQSTLPSGALVRSPVTSRQVINGRLVAR